VQQVRADRLSKLRYVARRNHGRRRRIQPRGVAPSAYPRPRVDAAPRFTFPSSARVFERLNYRVFAFAEHGDDVLPPKHELSEVDRRPALLIATQCQFQCFCRLASLKKRKHMRRRRSADFFARRGLRAAIGVAPRVAVPEYL
jgi:hypothetical protein